LHQVRATSAIPHGLSPFLSGDDQSSSNTLHKLHLRLAKLSAAPTLMSSQRQAEILREERSRKNVGIFQMAAILVLASIFAAGFCCGYGVRAWRSRKRSARYRLYAPYTPASMGVGRSQRPS
jgi:hypothetical protein